VDEWQQIIYRSLNQPEWRGVLHVSLFVFSVTEFLKRAWRRIGLFYNYADVWFLATFVGLLGSFYLWPPDSNIPWFIAGLIISGAVSFAHRFILIAIRWKFPELGAIITGDRRIRNDGPPNGIERRRPVGRRR